jgi:hypothetical protein
LRRLFCAALSLPDIAGISIATRPDCLGEEVLALLGELKDSFPDKFIWIEFGLQTIHEATAVFCNRGFSLPVFEKAAASVSALGIPYIVHIILGLPGETPEMMWETCLYLNRLAPFGIKLQLLHILKGTVLEKLYTTGSLPDFHVLSMEEYLDILIHCLELLRPDMVIHRLTGDGPKDLLIAPRWSLNKRNVLNTLHQTMKQQNTYQGRFYQNDTGPSNPL